MPPNFILKRKLLDFDELLCGLLVFEGDNHDPIEPLLESLSLLFLLPGTTCSEFSTHMFDALKLLISKKIFNLFRCCLEVDIFDNNSSWFVVICIFAVIILW